jgi:hypothetical protein
MSDKRDAVAEALASTQDDFESLLGGDTEPLVPTVTSSMDYPTIFADAVWFASNLGNVVRVQFIENQLEPTNSPQPGMKARHVGTLAMPRPGFKAMVQYLKMMDEYFDTLDSQNVAP